MKTNNYGLPVQKHIKCSLNAMWHVRNSGVAWGSVHPPEKRESPATTKNCFGFKNSKTLKVCSLFLSVNSEPKIIEPRQLIP